MYISQLLSASSYPLSRHDFHTHEAKILMIVTLCLLQHFMISDSSWCWFQFKHMTMIEICTSSGCLIDVRVWYHCHQKVLTPRIRYLNLLFPIVYVSTDGLQKIDLISSLNKSCMSYSYQCEPPFLLFMHKSSSVRFADSRGFHHSFEVVYKIITASSLFEHFQHGELRRPPANKHNQSDRLYFIFHRNLFTAFES